MPNIPEHTQKNTVFLDERASFLNEKAVFSSKRAALLDGQVHSSLPPLTSGQSLVQNLLVMCVMVPRGQIEVSCLSRVAKGPASGFPSGTQTSRALPGGLF